ncbi:MAG: hypothetical protein WBM90_06885 [Acidimicrobiia bacterium]
MSQPARFFDSRAAYMMFVRSTSEKAAVAARVGLELEHIGPGERALRVFDAGMGDASVLSQLMRQMHQAFPHIPWLIVGKEISVEDVRQSLERLPDRLAEHPETVFVVTNMHYRESPSLTPASPEDLVWREVALEGDTAHEFASQIREMYPTVAEDWKVRTSPKTGNPLYVHPAVLVLYRKDREFLLNQTIPKPASTEGQYDLVIASQTYRARTTAERKARGVLAPLANALAPGGRLIGVHAYGHDPGLEIIQGVWPGEEPFPTGRRDVLAAAERYIGRADFHFDAGSDEDSIFRFQVHSMPTERTEHIGTPSILAVWNAAAYVAQIDEARLSEAMATGSYLSPTTEAMRRHGTIWFNNESYVISRTEPSSRQAP